MEFPFFVVNANIAHLMILKSLHIMLEKPRRFLFGFNRWFGFLSSMMGRVSSQSCPWHGLDLLSLNFFFENPNRFLGIRRNHVIRSFFRSFVCFGTLWSSCLNRTVVTEYADARSAFVARGYRCSVGRSAIQNAFCLGGDAIAAWPEKSCDPPTWSLGLWSFDWTRDEEADDRG